MSAKFYLILFFSAFTFSAFGQTDTIAVSFYASWQKGDSHRYKITKRKTEQKKADSVRTSTEAYIANFIVEDSTTDGYLIHWDYEKQLTQDKELPKELNSVMQKYNDMQLKYKTVLSGEFVEIVNWQEMSKLMLESFDKIIQSDKKNAAVLAKIMAPIKQGFSSKEGIEGIVFKEVRLFHFIHGIVLTNYDTLAYADQLPNLLGGDPINAVGKVYLTEIDQKNQTCKVHHTLKPDKKDVQKMFSDIMTTFTKSTKFKNSKEKKAKLAEIQAELNKMELDMYDTTEILYDYNKAVPLKIDKSRFVKLKTAEYTTSKTDEVIIEAVN